MTPSKVEIVDAFRLEALSAPVDLESLAKKWGVVSIEQQPLESDAMLVRRRKGYSIVLKELNCPSGITRQNFSFAHELGHLLLQKYSVSQPCDVSTKHRLPRNRQGDEEQLCEKLAAEILMPRLSFEEDGWMEGWGLESVKTLSRKYHASIPATARRMIDLMPEVAVMATWKPAHQETEDGPKLLSSYGRDSPCGAPNFPRRSAPLLITQASGTHNVLSGLASFIDKRRFPFAPPDVPAQALGWGSDEYSRVMVWYYPDRKLARSVAAS